MRRFNRVRCAVSFPGNTGDDGCSGQSQSAGAAHLSVGQAAAARPLLLHVFPETSVVWGRVGPALAERFPRGRSSLALAAERSLVEAASMQASPSTSTHLHNSKK
jgi:hypothetical protein